MVSALRQIFSLSNLSFHQLMKWRAPNACKLKYYNPETWVWCSVLRRDEFLQLRMKQTRLPLISVNLPRWAHKYLSPPGDVCKRFEDCASHVIRRFWWWSILYTKMSRKYFVLCLPSFYAKPKKRTAIILDDRFGFGKTQIVYWCWKDIFLLIWILYIRPAV